MPIIRFTAKRYLVKFNVTYLTAKSNLRIPAGRIKEESIKRISQFLRDKIFLKKLGEIFKEQIIDYKLRGPGPQVVYKTYHVYYDTMISKENKSSSALLLIGYC